MNQSLGKYLQAFKKLRMDRSHGVAAPHKPILLLSVCQAYLSKIFDTTRIYLSPELVALFNANWNILVTTNHECRITYPFFYMKSEGFWSLNVYPQYHNFITSKTVIKGFNQLLEIVEYAEIENDLFHLLSEKHSNEVLQQFLLDEYFPKSKHKLPSTQAIKADLFRDIEDKILEEKAEEYRAEIKQLIKQHNEEEVFLRGSVFKREIPRIYNNTCCISGMRIDAAMSVSMIDACHIVPFSQSFDDTITNGIALCPNLHRAFDRGLIGIDEEYSVLVSNSFKEKETDYSIKRFEGNRINLPLDKSYWPKVENITWHRNNTFKIYNGNNH